MEFTEAIDAFNEQVNHSFNTDIIKLQNSDRLKKYQQKMPTQDFEPKEEAVYNFNL